MQANTQFSTNRLLWHLRKKILYGRREMLLQHKRSQPKTSKPKTIGGGELAAVLSSWTMLALEFVMHLTSITRRPRCT